MQTASDQTSARGVPLRSLSGTMARPAPSAPLPGAAAEGAVSWKTRVPGHRILVWYDDPDDPVWHERVLLWPSRIIGAGEAPSTRWLILTPDGDLYWEEMDCGRGKDVSKVSQLKKNGARPYLDHPIYSFDEPLDADALLGHIKTAFDTARTEAAAKKTSLQRFEKFLDWEGGFQDLPAAFLPPVRLPKGPGVPGAGAPAPGGSPGPAGAGSAPDRAWFLASPAPGKVIGDLIPFKESLWEDGKMALVKLDGGVNVALVEDPDGRSADKFLEEKSAPAADCYNLEPRSTRRTCGLWASRRTAVGGGTSLSTGPWQSSWRMHSRIGHCATTCGRFCGLSRSSRATGWRRWPGSRRTSRGRSSGTTTGPRTSSGRWGRRSSPAFATTSSTARPSAASSTCPGGSR